MFSTNGNFSKEKKLRTGGCREKNVLSVTKEQEEITKKIAKLIGFYRVYGSWRSDIVDFNVYIEH